MSYTRHEVTFEEDLNQIVERSREGHSHQSAIFELIDNSLDAGAKNITIELSRDDDHEIFQISDDGSGVSTETIGDCINKFFNPANREVKDTSKIGLFGRGLQSSLWMLSDFDKYIMDNDSDMEFKPGAVFINNYQDPSDNTLNTRKFVVPLEERSGKNFDVLHAREIEKGDPSRTGLSIKITGSVPLSKKLRSKAFKDAISLRYYELFKKRNFNITIIDKSDNDSYSVMFQDPFYQDYSNWDEEHIVELDGHKIPVRKKYIDETNLTSIDLDNQNNPKLTNVNGGLYILLNGVYIISRIGLWPTKAAQTSRKDQRVQMDLTGLDHKLLKKIGVESNKSRFTLNKDLLLSFGTALDPMGVTTSDTISKKDKFIKMLDKIEKSLNIKIREKKHIFKGISNLKVIVSDKTEKDLWCYTYFQPTKNGEKELVIDLNMRNNYTNSKTQTAPFWHDKLEDILLCESICLEQLDPADFLTVKSNRIQRLYTT